MHPGQMITFFPLQWIFSYASRFIRLYLCVQDKITNRSRGFGFIWFGTEEDKNLAIKEMHKVQLNDREISVTNAIPQSQTAPGTPGAARGGGRGRPDTRRPYDRFLVASAA
jgi:RNA recognition motif-containing protein